MSQAVVLWTGGKDCNLALHGTRNRRYEVEALVTFGPHGARFLVHPLACMILQVAELGLPHRLVEIAEPFRLSYRYALWTLASSGIDCVITGDIDAVAGRVFRVVFQALTWRSNAASNHQDTLTVRPLTARVREAVAPAQAPSAARICHSLPSGARRLPAS